MKEAWTFQDFTIQKDDDGNFELRYSDMLLKTFDSPYKAADAVYLRETGHLPWDQKPIGETMPSLDDWQRLR